MASNYYRGSGETSYMFDSSILHVFSSGEKRMRNDPDKTRVFHLAPSEPTIRWAGLDRSMGL